jgi:hypothetical protein
MGSIDPTKKHLKKQKNLLFLHMYQKFGDLYKLTPLKKEEDRDGANNIITIKNK